jgi:23S rRNA (cytosine1962-C5)-methyltransferase
MTISHAAVTVREDRAKPILNQHPWVFSGAIKDVKGNPSPGEIVDVRLPSGRFLAQGYWNPKSQIQVRLLTWSDAPVNKRFWRDQLIRAVAGRAHIHDSSAYRLINAENDFLPGLIVDLYRSPDTDDTWLVLQALTLGIDQRKEMIADLLMELIPCRGVYERSDVDVRGKEGLAQHTGVLKGDAPPERLPIFEGETPLLADLYRGHKTGFYLDQRVNRTAAADIIRHEFDSDASILNLFSYTGAFGARCLSHAATNRIVNVDASRDALELAESIISLQQADASQVEYVQADVFAYLRDMASGNERHDLVILDPPKFAHNQGQVEKAARGYKDINLNAFRVVSPGGYLMTFSCSGAISRDLFQKIVFGALADSGRQAQIVRHLSAADDHPIALTFPEGEYLKGLLLRVY